MMRINLIKILIINTFVLFFFNFAHPVTPEMLQDKNMPDSINGIMYSCMSLGMVLGSPYFGKKLNKMKINKIMIISLIGYALAQQLFGFANNVIIMGSGRVLSGICAGGWMVASLQYINQNTNQDNKTKFFAYIMVSNAFAGILGQIFAGFLGMGLDYHVIFIIQCIGLIVVTFLIIALKIKSNVESQTTIELEKHNDIVVKKKFKIVSIKSMMFPLILMFLFALSYTAINSQIGYYFSTSLNKGTFFVGFVNSYVNIITLIVNLFVIDYLYKRLKSPNIFIVGAGISILGIILILFLNINILIAMAFVMMGLVAYKPVLQKIILEETKISAGESLGFLNSSNSLGMVLGSFISGILYAKSPTYVLDFVLIIVIIILLLSVCKIMKKHIF